MATRKELALKHSFSKEMIFKFKTYGLIVKRSFRNILNNVKRFEDSGHLLSGEVIATSKSELWNKNDNEENWIMTAGKIQNLRIAAKRINGVEIPAGEIFSFWKYVRKPSVRNGYVVGREIREGCIVPSIAGGLCQLSNALYDAAVKANFQIVERHKHSQVVKGSLAEQDRDATVKWNYIDLRFVSDSDFRIEIEMDADHLFVRFKSMKKTNRLKGVRYIPQIAPSPLNDCYSCWNTDCYICNTKDKIANTGVVTYILDEKWTEYEQYVNVKAKEQDYILQPFGKSIAKNLKQEANYWNIRQGHKIYYNKKAFGRLLNYHKNKPKNIFSWQLKEDEKIAVSIIKQIPIETTHLVVSQNLLPFLYKYYAFAGRTYDVLMTRSSISRLQADLDIAHTKYTDSPTLSDFRASERIIALEQRALDNAAKIITPHSKVASEFTNVEYLRWNVNPTLSTRKDGSAVLFPASLLARKGAYEMRQLTKELSLQLVVLGKSLESPDFMKGIDYTQAGKDVFEGIGLVVLPAYAEHCPRLLLKAISLGIPVVVSEACGIAADENITVVPTGDYEQLKSEVEKACCLLHT